MRTRKLPLKPLLLTATNTKHAKLEENEDATCIDSGVPALAVADGMGSFVYSGDAARFVTGEIISLLSQRVAKQTLSQLFTKVQISLQQHATPFVLAEQLNPKRSFGTTLLLAMELPEALSIAYIGNGAIFHIPGDFFTHAPTRAGIPWTFGNLLRPHTIPKGPAALVRYFDASGETEFVEPSMLLVGKDRTVGDILLLCTDGVYSSDEARVSRPDDGTAWHEISPALMAISQALRTEFCKPTALTAERIQLALQNTLDNLRASGALDDDATVGLLITEKAVDFHRDFHNTGN
jgi:PPM family protein phosphatase